MICLSYDGTIKQMWQLAIHFDEDVVMWSNTLKENIHVSYTTRMSCNILMYILTQEELRNNFHGQK